MTLFNKLNNEFIETRILRVCKLLRDTNKVHS